MQRTIERRGKSKKPKGFPKRPMSAYNFFFKHERQKMLIEELKKSPLPPHLMNKAFETGRDRPHRKRHGKIPFQYLVHTVATKWKTIDPELKRTYNEQAKIAKQQYILAIAAWKRSNGQLENSSQSNFEIQVVGSPTSEYNLFERRHDARMDREPIPISHPIRSEIDVDLAENQGRRDIQCDAVGTPTWLMSQLDNDSLNYFVDTFASEEVFVSEWLNV